MNFSLKKSFFTILFISFFTTSCKPSLTKKEVIGYSVAAAAGAAILTGAYLLWSGDDDSLDNMDVVDKDGEKVLQPKNVEKKKFKQVLADALKFMIVPSAVGLGTYWILNKHTTDGKVKNFNARRVKILEGLGKKFSNGASSLAHERLSEDDIIKLVNANFGKDMQCPLIEAVKYLKDQREVLQEQIKLLDEEKLAGTCKEGLKAQAEDAKNLSDRISIALDAIQKQKDYQEQLKRYDSLEKDRKDREELNTQRKYNFAMLLAIIAGASSIAGKVVAPFVG